LGKSQTSKGWSIILKTAAHGILVFLAAPGH